MWPLRLPTILCVAARKLIVQQSLQYLDRLSNASAGDISLQRERVTAYSKIGKVQGYPGAANLGDTAGALESFRKALAIREAIAAARPHDVDDQIALCAARRVLGRLQAGH